MQFEAKFKKKANKILMREKKNLKKCKIAVS